LRLCFPPGKLFLARVNIKKDMKTNLPITALVGCSLAASGFNVSAQNTPFYVQGDAGGTLTQSADLKEFFGPVAPGSRVKFDPGFRLGITGGFHVTDWFSLEAVTGVMSSKIDSITDASSVHDSFLSNVPLMAGVRFELPHPMRISPYVGASAGGSVSVLDADHIDIGGTHIHGTESDVVFAYQAYGGVRYALNDHMGVSLEYHFFSAEDPEWRSDHVFGTTTDKLRMGGVSINALSLAFQYRF